MPARRVGRFKAERSSMMRANSIIRGYGSRIKGSQNAVNTDAAGKFSLSVRLREASSLEISFVGFETKVVAITASADIRVFRMVPTRSSLDEVVVVGYGTQKRKDDYHQALVASVKGSAIKELPVTSVTAALQGEELPGSRVIDNSGQPGGPTPEIIIRGVSSLHQPAPLYIVDGVRVPGDAINIQDIATVDLSLK